MNALKPITIVGGGLAGLTLGIALRQKEVPVTLFEAGHYPRHRVCGEFISGEGLKTLGRLGLVDKFRAAGAQPAQTALFFSPRSSSGIQKLPQSALCLSRYEADALLAREFREMGGELNENTRWTQSFGEGVVRATGRRIHAQVDGWRWFGLKVHASNVSLAADLEMHLVPDGYIGLCRLNEREVNICGLFRSRHVMPELASRWKEVIKGPQQSKIAERLAHAIFDENSFCSVAGISTHPSDAAEHSECCVGDAITTIAPVTGNGMSMAFESAEIAANSLESYSRGQLSWDEAKKKVSTEIDRCFHRRLTWANQTQRALFNSLLDEWICAALKFPFVWKLMFSHTR